MVSLLLLVAAATPNIEAPPFTGDGKRQVVAALSDRLVDGESARWRWLQPRRQDSGLMIYCGWVNGKNRLGGYTGFQTFWAVGVWADGKFDVALSEFNNAAVARQMCEKAGFDMSEMPAG